MVAMTALAGFNSRTPCGVRRHDRLLWLTLYGVSIHAPRVGCDLDKRYIDQLRPVSIHAPRVGCDCGAPLREYRLQKFQFTHPVWGATPVDMYYEEKYGFQFTHPVWGATKYLSSLSLA